MDEPLPILGLARQALASGPAALLIRHAEREHIHDPARSADVPLTAAGRRAARRLGEALAEVSGGSPIIAVGHSPVPRCVDTAGLLADGLAASGITVVRLGSLGFLGGAYLRDVEAALGLARDRGGAFVREWFDGRLPPHLLVPLDETARTQVQGAHHALGTAGLAVLVTHDWNVMAVRERFFGIRHEEAGLLDFLDGVAVTPRGGAIGLMYRDRVVDVLPPGRGVSKAVAGGEE